MRKGTGPMGHLPGRSPITPRTVGAFLLTLALCLILVVAVVLNRSTVEQLKMSQLIMEKSAKINDAMARLLYKTQMLASLVLQDDGKTQGFERIAATVINDPAILNVLLAPGGIVTHVYPLEGNESVLGLDFFAPGAGNSEALVARDSGQLVLGGPFDAIQGHQVLVGRLPVYLENAQGEETFWGLVSVTLKYPDALDSAGLSELAIQGFAYEIWRMSPETREKQVIASSGHSYSPLTPYVEKSLIVANAQWYFRILPVRIWHQFPETWAVVTVSLFISLLVAALVKNNQELKALRDSLVELSNTDPLTCVYNRRGFMEIAGRQLERVTRKGSKAFILLFDLDHFKIVNDTYGHQSGDRVLKEISTRVFNALRPYDSFARYGGEEFIILATDIDCVQAVQLAERLRILISETPVSIGDKRIAVTASFGVAAAAPLNILSAAIAIADTALYQAKEDGRNRSVYFEA